MEFSIIVLPAPPAVMGKNDSLFALFLLKKRRGNFFNVKENLNISANEVGTSINLQRV